MTASHRTPLGRARGMGSAHHGVSHWVWERVTATALIPLTLWAVLAALKLAAAPDYATAAAWIGRPVNGVLLTLFTAIGFLHMHAGLRVVVEDYVGRPLSRTLLLMLNLFICLLAGALAVFSIFKVALGGA